MGLCSQMGQCFHLCSCFGCSRALNALHALPEISCHLSGIRAVSVLINALRH